jgi:DNA ligase (NAD+)
MRLVKKLPSAFNNFSLQDDNQKIVEKLQQKGLVFETKSADTASNILQNKTFVISGVFQKVSREKLAELIEQNGGKNTSSVSAKTNYLVAGENMGPAKLEKATKLGVTIISEDDFLAMISA